MSETEKIQYEMFVQQQHQTINQNMNYIKSLQDQSQDNNISPYACIAITTYYLKNIAILFDINNKYYSLHNKNNEGTLDEIRKIFNTILRNLKEVFGISITSRITNNSNTKNLDLLTPKRLLNLITKLELYCKKLKDSYGLKSKYHNIIANIYGGICGFAINSINFKIYLSRVRDLKDPESKEIRSLLDLTYKLLEQSATLYMDTFTLTNDVSMINKGIMTLEVLEKFCRLSNITQILPELVRKKQSWERILEQHT